MVGIRIAIYFAYAIIFVFVIGLIVAGIWAAQQAMGMAAAFLVTPTPGEIAAATVAPTVIYTEGTPVVVRVLPTRTVLPPPPRTSTRILLCVETVQAKQHIGATTCVRGVVVNMYATESAVFAEFDQPGTGFFGTVINPPAPLTSLVGQCIELAGTIRDYQGRPYIIFQPDEAKGCPNP